jgi:hypothetical protein
LYLSPKGPNHPPDGITSTNHKLLSFLTTKHFF